MTTSPPAKKDERAKKASGEVIQISKQCRLAWVDLLAIDPRVSAIAFMVATLIGIHFNSQTGSTYVSLERLAKLAGVSKRTIQSAISQLERQGYLEIDRNDLGITTKNGIRAVGGRGHANVYYPAFERERITALTRAQKVVAHCHLLLEERWQNSARKVEADCHPTHNPSFGREPTWLFEHLVEGDQKLAQRAAEFLVCELGRDTFRSWFGRVRVEAISPPIVMLIAPSQFNAKRIRDNFETSVLAAWKSVEPKVREVKIGVGSNSGGEGSKS